MYGFIIVILMQSPVPFIVTMSELSIEYYTKQSDSTGILCLLICII